MEFKDSLSNINKLQQSLAILEEYAIELKATMRLAGVLEIYNPFKNEFPGTLFRIFHKNIILSVCCWLDEYTRHLGITTEKEYAERIAYIKKVCKTYKKEINKWKHLREFRNNIIAHNYRREEQFVFADPSNRFMVPRGIEDLYQLVSCIFEMHNIVAYEFREERALVSFSSHETIEESTVKMRESEDMVEYIGSLRIATKRTTGYDFPNKDALSQLFAIIPDKLKAFYDGLAK